MVERPADVLPMDKTNPPQFDWFTRADMALRRMPGLGFAIVVFILDFLHTQDRTGLFLIFAALAVVTLANEFWRPRAIIAQPQTPPRPVS